VDFSITIQTVTFQNACNVIRELMVLAIVQCYFHCDCEM